MKDLNIEQITPDPVMAILHVWLMYMKSWLVIIPLCTSVQQIIRFLCVPQPCGGLTADQLIFEVDQPYRDTNCG